MLRQNQEKKYLLREEFFHFISHIISQILLLLKLSYFIKKRLQIRCYSISHRQIDCT